MKAAPEKQVDCNYLYRENDILLINKARNWRSKFDYAWLPDERGVMRVSGVLVCEDNTCHHENIVTGLGGSTAYKKLTKDAFVRNSSGGIVIDLPAMSLRGREADAHRAYLSDAIRDIVELGKDNAKNNIFPAKIIFPYNPGGGHWIAGELIIKYENGEYSAEMRQYNPMLNIAQNIDADFSHNFCTLFRIIAHKPLKLNTGSLPRIGRNVDNGVKVAIQTGGVACGVFTAYALDRLKIDTAENMWNDFLYDDWRALAQRKEDAVLVDQCMLSDYRGGITEQEYLKLGLWNSNRLAIPAKSFHNQEKEFLATLKKPTLTELELKELIKKIDSYQSHSKRKIWNQIFCDKEVFQRIAKNDSVAQEILKLFSNKISVEECAKIIQQNDDAISAINKASSPSSSLSINDVNDFVNSRQQKSQESIGLFKEILSGDDDLNVKLGRLEGLIDQYRGDQKLLQKFLTATFDDSNPKNEDLRQIISEKLFEIEPLISGSNPVLPATSGHSSESNPINIVLNHEKLLQALTNQDLPSVKALWDDKINLQYVSKKDGSVILHKAVQNKDLEVVKYAIEKCGDVARSINVVDDNQQTPLMIAVLCGNSGAIDYLIEKGADINLVDYDGRNALLMAQEMLELYPDESPEKENYAKIITSVINKFSASSIASPVLPSAAAPALPAVPVKPKEGLLEQVQMAQKGQKAKRNYFSIEQSDFRNSDEEELKRRGEDLKEAQEKVNKGEMPRKKNYHRDCIEITGDEISFQAVKEIVKGKESATKYTKVSGSLSDNFKTESAKKDGSCQLYYANFRGMKFKETPGKPIFQNADLFMANCCNCTFENVDFSEVQNFKTIQFDRCKFVGCKFPEDIEMENSKEDEESKMNNRNEARFFGVEMPSGKISPVSYKCLFEGKDLSIAGRSA